MQRSVLTSSGGAPRVSWEQSPRYKLPSGDLSGEKALETRAERPAWTSPGELGHLPLPIPSRCVTLRLVAEEASDEESGEKVEEKEDHRSGDTVDRFGDSLGHDTRLLTEVSGQLRMLASTLPEKYRAEQLVEAAIQPNEVGAHLAQLYIQRAYRLLDEDYINIPPIEQQIRELREQSGA